MADGFTGLCKPLHQDSVIHNRAATISPSFPFLDDLLSFEERFQEVCVSLSQDLPDASS